MEVDAAYDEAVRRLDVLAADGARPLTEPMLQPPGPRPDGDPLGPDRFAAPLSSDLYMAAVEAAKEYIRAGDIFRLVLSKRFDFDLGEAEPRDLLAVAGPDAGTYLHGQLSQNVTGLAIGASAWTLLPQPQGKVDAWMRL